MTPDQLQANQFTAYPPQAKLLVTGHVALFRKLPIAFLSLLLRELISYDWKFPAERRDMDQQLAYLSSLSADELGGRMKPFAQLQLPPELERADWVNSPVRFAEQLSAHLWATHQIDSFRAAAVDYIQTAKSKANAPVGTAPVNRLGLAMIGQGVDANEYKLFRKLRPHGVYFAKLRPEGGEQAFVDLVTKRVSAHPEPFSHWYIDGGTGEATLPPKLSCVAYQSLAPARIALLGEMEKMLQAGDGPEMLRTKLAEMRPEQIGLEGQGEAAVLNRFQLSVLTEGSGTQLFSTTFVQWTAREVLRRAQPSTLLTRYSPRQRDRANGDYLSGRYAKPELDPQGSLIDADMGAYYTWINQQRLPGAETSSFIVWFEGHNEAVAIGPSFAAGTESKEPITVEHLLKRVA